MLKPKESWRYTPWLAALLIGFAGTASAAETALDRYVAKPDANYSFREYLTKHEIGYSCLLYTSRCV